MGRWTRRAALVGAAWSLLTLGVAAADDQLTVTKRGDRLSVTAKEVSLADVLAEVARVARVDIVADPSVRPKLAQEAVTTELGDIGVDDGIRRLLQRYNSTFLYTSAGLSEVRVYGEGSGGGELSPVTGARRSRPETVRRRPPDEGKPPTEAESDVGDAAAMARAVEALDRATDPQVLEQALDTLSQADVPPLEPLLRFVESSHSAELRTQALDMLNHHEKDARVAQILRRLVNDPDEDVRDTARQMLDSMEVPATAPRGRASRR